MQSGEAGSKKVRQRRRGSLALLAPYKGHKPNRFTKKVGFWPLKSHAAEVGRNAKLG